MVEVQTVPDTFVQLHLRLVSHVDVHVSLHLQYSVLVIDLSENDPVSQCFGHHKFNIFRWNV